MTTNRPIPPLSSITEKERQRILAYVKTGSFAAAADLLGCDRDTVRDTVERYREELRTIQYQAIQNYFSAFCGITDSEA